MPACTMAVYDAYQRASSAGMIKVNRDVCDGAGVTVVWLRPNRALSERGMWLLGLILVGTVMATGLLVATRGNVFAPLFATIDSVIVALGLVAAWRHGNRSERIRVDADVVEVETRPGGRRARFQSGWVRVRLQECAGRQHLWLSSHGRKLEIGAFLADPEREALLEKLNAALRSLKAPRGLGNRDA